MFLKLNTVNSQILKQKIKNTNGQVVTTIDVFLQSTYYLIEDEGICVRIDRFDPGRDGQIKTGVYFVLL